MTRRRVVIMGAAGRDFHNFNTLFRDREDVEVVAFTAAQIPDIEGRTYPPELAGKLYPSGIPIRAEEDLQQIIVDEKIDDVWFSYSDVSHEDVMHKGSAVVAGGAHFGICSATRTMIASKRPVVAVTAVRTGVGKSQTSRYISKLLQEMGKRVVSVRHPMPYGDLAAQACQRFATYEDLDRHQCTIEEREEYEPIIAKGAVVYAGVDYGMILERAEEEADVVLWDGGNNDTPFYKPDLHITLVDPHRPGHESTYYPGESNLLMADVIVINKVQTAAPEDVERVEENCRRLNPTARIYRCRSEIVAENPGAIAGKRVLVVEDGPTLTHGGMQYGAGWFAAKDAGAAEIIAPEEYAVGSILETYRKYPNAKKILPAMGYGKEQMRELQETINAVPADVVIGGTPIDLSRIVEVNKPMVNVTYELAEMEPGKLKQELERALRG